MTTITEWGKAGVFWTGQPGDEIQRVDDMSDYERDEPIFDGDMEAAIFVAKNSEYPFVLYVQDEERWSVEVHPTREAADEALTYARKIADDDGYVGSLRQAFVFDGRSETPVDNDDQGYLAPVS